MNQIINMIMRILMRKAINSGINAGIGAASGLARRRQQNKQDQPGQQLSETDRAHQAQVQDTAGQAKKMMRMTRRFTRF